MVLCPACGSSRIRHDYRPAPLYLRLFLVRALLCDHCNRQFRAFSLRMPGDRQSTRPRRRADTFVQSPLTPMREGGKIELDSVNHSHDESRLLINQIVERQQPVAPINPADIEVSGRGTVNAEEDPNHAKAKAIVCPDCGSSRIKRRPRKTLERLFLSITDHRAYVCRECQNSFYDRPSH